MAAQNFAGGWKPESRPATQPAQILQDICENRREAFLQAWKADGFAMTYVEPGKSPGKIRVWHHPKGGEMHLGGVTALPEFSMSDAVVVTHDHDDEYFSPALWVRKGFQRYRDAYARFVTEVHGFNDDLKVSSLGYDVDHLRNSARTPTGTYIRVEACPSFSNRGWGSTYEGAASKLDLKHPLGKADWMTVAKLSGIQPPRDWDDDAGIRRILAFAAHHEIDVDMDLSEHLIRSDFMIAYRLRKKNKELLEQAQDWLGRNPVSKHIVGWRD